MFVFGGSRWWGRAPAVDDMVVGMQSRLMNRTSENQPVLGCLFGVNSAVCLRKGDTQTASTRYTRSRCRAPIGKRALEYQSDESKWAAKAVFDIGAFVFGVLGINTTESFFFGVTHQEATKYHTFDSGKWRENTWYVVVKNRSQLY